MRIAMDVATPIVRRIESSLHAVPPTNDRRAAAGRCPQSSARTGLLRAEDDESRYEAREYPNVARGGRARISFRPDAASGRPSSADRGAVSTHHVPRSNVLPRAPD